MRFNYISLESARQIFTVFLKRFLFKDIIRLMFRKLLRIFIPALFVVVVFIGLEFSQVDKIRKVLNRARVTINNQVIVADVVKDQKSREKGLSDRDRIGINEGMLFVFENKSNHTFWMKGMEFPIDIIWISGNKIVGIERHVQPEPGKKESELTIYTPPEPIDKVLEVKAGRSLILDANKGNKVGFDPLVPNALKIN